MYAEDTIVAPATPPGKGAVAIVRLSGARAMQIAAILWHPSGAAKLRQRRLSLGEIRDPQSGAIVDRAMCVTMPGPASLTGEDVAELHCHGGPYIVRRVLRLAMAAGARMAEPGEFSRRAFLNGRMDLTEAEAVADLIDVRSESALQQAIAQLNGALAQRVGQLRSSVIAIRAHLEAEIDFADEGLNLPGREEIAADIARLAADVALLHDSFRRGRLARDGARATIVGRPNAGKSSVLNLLLGADRAIVTAVPGTTRDVIEESVTLYFPRRGAQRERPEHVRGVQRERAAIWRAETPALVGNRGTIEPGCGPGGRAAIFAAFDSGQPRHIDHALFDPGKTLCQGQDRALLRNSLRAGAFRPPAGRRRAA